MSLIFSLKMLCDLCIYYSFAGFLATFYNGRSDLRVLILPVIAAAVSVMLRDKGNLRYLAPLLLIPAFLRSFILVDILLLLPPTIYLITLIIHLDQFSGRFDYSDIFSAYARLYPVFALIMAFNWSERLLTSSLPFALMFFISGVLLLRILRHNPEVVFNQRFLLNNSLGILIATTAGIFLGSPWSVYLYKSILSNFYFRVVAPILIFFVTCVVYILRPLFALIESMANRSTVEEVLTLSGEFEQIEYEEVLLRQSSDFLRAVFYLAVISLLIYLTYRLFKKLNVYQMKDEIDGGVTQRRYSLAAGESSTASNRGSNPIREVYRRYILMCQRDGFKLEKFTTSADLAHHSLNRVPGSDLPQRLRDIYIAVRYGDLPAGREEIDQAKSIISILRDNHGE